MVLRRKNVGEEGMTILVTDVDQGQNVMIEAEIPGRTIKIDEIILKTTKTGVITKTIRIAEIGTTEIHVTIVTVAIIEMTAVTILVIVATDAKILEIGVHDVIIRLIRDATTQQKGEDHVTETIEMVLGNAASPLETVPRNVAVNLHGQKMIAQPHRMNAMAAHDRAEAVIVTTTIMKRNLCLR